MDHRCSDSLILIRKLDIELMGDHSAEHGNIQGMLRYLILLASQILNKIDLMIQTSVALDYGCSDIRQILYLPAVMKLL